MVLRRRLLTKETVARIARLATASLDRVPPESMAAGRRYEFRIRLSRETPTLDQHQSNSPHAEEGANPYRAPRSMDESDPSPAGFPRWGWGLIWAVLIVDGLLLLLHMAQEWLPSLGRTVLLYGMLWGVPISTGVVSMWLTLWTRYSESDLQQRKTVLPLLVSIITVWGLLMAFSYASIIAK